MPVKTKNKRPSRTHPARQVVKTRKKHVCRKCGCTIFAGTEAVLRYVKNVENKSGLVSLDYDRYYLHINCENMEEAKALQIQEIKKQLETNRKETDRLMNSTIDADTLMANITAIHKQNRKLKDELKTLEETPND